MSMSKKIYAVVALLVVLSIGIMGLAVYSIFTISDVTMELVAMGNRSTALSNIDKLILDRTIITREIKQATQEEDIAALINGRMLQNENAMQKYLDDYNTNLTPGSSDDARSVGPRLADLWNDFVKESKVVSDYALENTNNKANRLNGENVAFWDGLDADMDKLAGILFQQNDPEYTEYGRQVLELESDLVRIRLALVKYIFEPEPDAAAQYRQTIMNVVQEVDSTIGKFVNTLPPAKGGTLADALMKDKLDTIGKKLITDIIALVDRNSNGLANDHMVGPTRTARVKVEQLTGEYLDRIAAAQAASQAQTDEIKRTSLIMMVAVSLIGILVATILAWRVISNVVTRLNRIILGLGDSSERVFGSSGQVSDAAHSLAEGATEQAASLEQTSSALEQMASMTRQNADNATKTSETMDNTLKLVENGAETVRSVTVAMAEISESAEKIGNIIKTIEEIAFQTNLLALNAAVEAARAGEAGKGFAVVADEVRNLAQRSAQAAKDTSELIRSTVERVQVGSENVAHLAEGFSGIDEASQNVGKLVTEISSATNEQAQGVDQVNTAVAQMDKVTQNNAASAEQSASAASEMSEQADKLKIMVDDLISLVEGKKQVITIPPNSINGGNGKHHGDEYTSESVGKHGERLQLTLTH